MFFYGPLRMDMPVLAEKQELIYISSVQTQDVLEDLQEVIADRDR